ncbi:unnamed protein product [Polarella glacialis]|uniref:RRM domain-containing protein n=1 Tax=Polarella glacialis TaxID=89957 RepID=A0A813H539_POLGL|nr:unnamed protein product [Polarella glacialis]
MPKSGDSNHRSQQTTSKQTSKSEQTGIWNMLRFKAKGLTKALLSYSSASEAKNAAASLNGTTIEGSSRPVFVRIFEKKEKFYPASAAIFVGGFAPGTAISKLRAHFGTAGSIVEIKLLGKSSALVTYSSDEEGRSAIASLKGKSMDGSDKSLEIRVDGSPVVHGPANHGPANHEGSRRPRETRSQRK